MTRAQAFAYLAAVVGWITCFVLVAVLGTGDATSAAVATVAPVGAFVCCTVLMGLAIGRVQRGEVAADRDDWLMPAMAEFTLMGFGGRVPLAVASLRDESRGAVPGAAVEHGSGPPTAGPVSTPRGAPPPTEVARLRGSRGRGAGVDDDFPDVVVPSAPSPDPPAECLAPIG